jgi:hypothetical protein
MRMCGKVKFRLEKIQSNPKSNLGRLATMETILKKERQKEFIQPMATLWFRLMMEILGNQALTN